MNTQTILTASADYAALDRWLEERGVRHLLLVCDQAIAFLRLDGWFRALPERKPVQVSRFSDFQPNPAYESVVSGVRRFREAGCDAIIAVGGGSAMDVAKCIKLYCNLPEDTLYLKQTIVPNEIPLLAVPTTAGTGSEATRYAVIYYNGEKQSVSHESCIPGTVLLDSSVLKTLPLYQKKSTMLDALCHAVEAFWSVNSTEESKAFSRAALDGILHNLEGYLANEDAANEGMLRAANLAGKAINITQTTAAHAMCYKLTSLYGVAHGHAAALCLRRLFPWMLEHTQRCIDPRGRAFLENSLQDLAAALHCQTPRQAAEAFCALFERLELSVPAAQPEDYALLKHSVNPVRLKNFPIALDIDTIDTLYHEILS